MWLYIIVLVITVDNELDDSTCVLDTDDMVPTNYPVEPVSDLESESIPEIDPLLSDQSQMIEWRAPPSAKRTAALFLLTLQEKYKLSQKAIDFAVGSISTIISSVCDSIKNDIQSSFAAETHSVINSCFDYEDPISSLLTEYQQSKFYREEFGLVVRS